MSPGCQGRHLPRPSRRDLLEPGLPAAGPGRTPALTERLCGHAAGRGRLPSERSSSSPSAPACMKASVHRRSKSLSGPDFMTIAEPPARRGVSGQPWPSETAEVRGTSAAQGSSAPGAFRGHMPAWHAVRVPLSLESSGRDRRLPAGGPAMG
ncbi:MAG: hypothetical protein LBT40_06510 [Deltaproteobacteria bacterium]|nr:hypothetical protein [Deltaproteobacteria bacterium]